MIRLRKGDEPTILVQNSANWTRELMDLLREPQGAPDYVWNRYRRPEIKSAVRRDGHDKCFYCESKIPHVAPGDVEHIKPKTKFPALTYEWTNLAYVCNECNRRKSDTYDNDLPPLNPFIENPDDHLIPSGAFVFARLGDARGDLTILLVELNRPQLLERRGESIKRLRRLAESIAGAANDTHRRLLTQELCQEVVDSKEYAFVGRGLLRALGVAGSQE